MGWRGWLNVRKRGMNIAHCPADWIAWYLQCQLRNGRGAEPWHCPLCGFLGWPAEAEQTEAIKAGRAAPAPGVHAEVLPEGPRQTLISLIEIFQKLCSAHRVSLF